ncbi:Nuclear factor interleukin-3-regulated protein [Dirofilaria immitis]|nr:Nuclear factor interleukin-3-regulated protein [Dirofilaria immitis]
MDGLGIESCSSSSSLRGLNLIASNNHVERQPSDSSNSSETSVSPGPSSNIDSNRPYWEKRCHNANIAKGHAKNIMEQKLLELTKENNLLRNRLKQQQQRLVTSSSHDSVIVSTAQRKDTVGPVIPTIPSPPVSSVTTLVANLANVTGPPTKLPAIFPTHLFATTPLLATSSGSALSPIFPPSGTAPTSLLTSASAATQVTTSAPQQLPALQICTLQAALQQVQQNYCSSSGPTAISSGHGAFQPFHSSRDPTSSTQSYSPDSSTTDVVPVDYSIHGTTIHTEISSDPLHILRYQLLERQADLSTKTEMEQRLSNNALTQSSSSSSSLSSEKFKESNSDDKPGSLLGSLLSTKRTSPLVAQSRTDTHSGLNNASPNDNDLKNCLNSLAVNLTTALAVPGTRTTVSNVSSKTGTVCSLAISGSTVTTKSDSSDSTESPTSNNSTTDSIRSQFSSTSKHSAIVKALRSRPSSKQQYMDRRRRNNEAAKRCRANRRAQFEYRSKRAQQLEAENDELRREMNHLNEELEQLKALHAAKNATTTTTLQR